MGCGHSSNFGDSLPQSLPGRQVHHHNGFQIHESPTAGKRLKLLKLLWNDGDGLFTDHMLAMLQKEPGLSRMEKIGTGDIHRIDITFGHGGGIGINHSAPIGSSKGFSPGCIPGTDSGKPHLLSQQGSIHKGFGNPAGADDSITYHNPKLLSSSADSCQIQPSCSLYQHPANITILLRKLPGILSKLGEIPPSGYEKSDIGR